MSQITMNRRVVCAACWSKCGRFMVLGVRHWDRVMGAASELISSPDGKDIKWHGEEQGFIDNSGNYLSREEAWEVAENAGQIIRRTGDDGVLYSENLY